MAQTFKLLRGLLDMFRLLRAFLHDGLSWVLAIVLALYAFFLSRGYGQSEARMISFSSLVIANLGLIFANRSRTRSILATLSTPNPALWWVTGGTLAFLILALVVPFFRGLFSFAPLHLWELVLIALAGLLSVFVSESLKLRLFQKFMA